MSAKELVKFEKGCRSELYEEETKVEYLTSVERIGMEKGREEGRLEILLELIESELADRFGAKGRRLVPKVRAMREVSELRKVARLLITAKSLDEVREYLK